MSPSSQPVIQLSGVSKHYGHKLALDEVSIEVPAGVVFALLGENGAGKTTMIRILTGFLRPDQGQARVLQNDCVASATEIRRRVGYVSDSPALYDWMRPEEIGWFTSAFYGDTFPARYMELLQGFDVPLGTKIKDLSKGQRAKVALALATAHDPELLILDEPTSGLDPMVRRQFLESMVDRAAAGRSVLLSSHQISEVERVADWIAILHQGKIRVAERLDTLKSSTSIVTATLEHSDVVTALPPGEVFTESRNGRQIRWLVKDMPERWQTDFSPDRGVQSVSATPATLEEIFVAVCDDRATRPNTQHELPDAPEPALSANQQEATA